MKQLERKTKLPLRARTAHDMYMYMFIGGVLDSPIHNALTNGTHMYM